MQQLCYDWKPLPGTIVAEPIERQESPAVAISSWLRRISAISMVAFFVSGLIGAFSSMQAILPIMTVSALVWGLVGSMLGRLEGDQVPQK
jgi:hypothetical protein